jgi:hypothetical protein
MGRPWPTLGPEGAMVGWVPVAGQKNGETVSLKEAGIVQEGWNDFTPAADAQRSSWEKIILDVSEEQRIMGCEGNHRSRREVGQIGRSVDLRHDSVIVPVATEGECTPRRLAFLRR